MALFTLAEFKTHEGIVGTSLDAFVTAMIPRSLAALERLTNRKLEAASFTEDYGGNGTPNLFLRYPPINSITEIKESDTRDFASVTAIPSSDYVLDSEAGILKRVEATEIAVLRTGAIWPSGDYNIRVVYNGGFSTVPEDLKEAAMLWTSLRLRRRGSIGIVSETIGSHTATFRSSGSDADLDAIIARYKIAPTVTPVRDAS